MTNEAHDHCWHCGEAIPSNVNLSALIQGEERPMCCAGCQMVASIIHDSGLDRYYDFRDGLPKRPQSDSVGRHDYVAWDRDAVLSHHANTDCDGLSTIHLVLENIHCSACAWLIQRFTKLLEGVHDVSVDTADGRATIIWNQSKTQLSDIAHQLATLGYTPHLDSPDASIRRNQLERRSMLKRMVVAGLGMMQVMSYALAGYIGAFQDLDPQTARFFQLVSMLVAVPVALYAGQGFYQSAWKTMKHGRLGMDVPVSLAILIALSASIGITLFGHGETYFDSVVMFIFFLLLGRYAVMVARQDAGQLHSALARSLPNQVSRLTGRRVEQVGLIELAVGDHIQVGLGETIPADGRVVEGQASINEALLSGEAKPRERGVGDEVLAGTQLTRGQLVIEIQKMGQQTALSDVIRLLDRTRQFKPRTAQMADQVAGWFIAFVLIGSLCVGAVWWMIEPTQTLPIMLSVLVVSCPCALALGTPVALAAAARGFGRLGLLINRPDALEGLSSITHVVLDKTGTLTQSQMAVVQIRDPYGQAVSDVRLEQWAGRLERISRHPVASAFSSMDDGGEITDAQEIAHEGVMGVIDGVPHFLGKASFVMHQIGQAIQAPDEGAWVALADKQGVLAWFELDNPLRQGAQALIEGLKDNGLVLWLASGDQPAAVEKVAKDLGITRYASQCSPQDKVDLMRKLQNEGGRVVMIGDGINDAPVLAGADVSMSLAEGADIARTQADIVMTGASLSHVHQAFLLAPRVKRIIRQNLIWAITYNALAFPMAAMGLVPPWAAAIGMSASSLLVVLNGRRAGTKITNNQAVGSMIPDGQHTDLASQSLKRPQLDPAPPARSV